MINNPTSIYTKPNLIFLDIDGPIINTPCFYIDPEASVSRTVMNTQAIGYVKRLVEKCGALVVLNTTHNVHDIEDPLTAKITNIKTDLIKWGMKDYEFHSDWQTEYPYPTNGKMSEHRRWTAVKNWLAKNGDHNWIAFDDDLFHNQNQYLIDFRLGIDYDAYKWAVEKFNPGVEYYD
jgi:hypothetical protein